MQLQITVQDGAPIYQQIVEQVKLLVAGGRLQLGSKPALDDVSVFITRGGVLGLVGEKGAGKTTLNKHLDEIMVARAGGKASQS
jgi:ABC-type polysaccharide/polyol phosphate transport system ATPase subunit